MTKNKLVVSDNNVSLIYDRPFKSLANLYEKELIDFILENYCKELNIQSNEYEIINNEIRTINDKDKLMVSDLIYKVNKSTILNIELNTTNSKYLMYKNLLYVYKIIINNQNKGEKYKDIKVIQINFDLYSFKNMNKVKNVVKVVNVDNNQEYLDTFTIIHLELDKAWNNEYNVSEDGIRFLRMLSSNSKRLNRYLAGNNPFLNKVADFMEEYSSNGDNLLYYNEEELSKYIRKSELIDSYNDGKSQGLSQGKLQEKLEIAKRMLLKNKTISEIIDITGLTKKEILKLQDN